MVTDLFPEELRSASIAITYHICDSNEWELFALEVSLRIVEKGSTADEGPDFEIPDFCEYHTVAWRTTVCPTQPHERGTEDATSKYGEEGHKAVMDTRLQLSTTDDQNICCVNESWHKLGRTVQTPNVASAVEWDDCESASSVGRIIPNSHIFISPPASNVEQCEV
ncbi:hypothetical protein N7495_006834 [Penicillium taxi]|uniref:uncharacterized protein n=1 Tax=Penicillium taxi TaxID=168475 RepID=UPI002544F07C|nr:uncharacterized protein N7495_006834 [Penicillium taxi]KAJ5895143.1 hypothetical protein N7495_006834 [Penicillium taxi]